MQKIHDKFSNKLSPEHVYYYMQVRLSDIPEDQFPFDLAIRTFAESVTKKIKLKQALLEVLNQGALQIN